VLGVHHEMRDCMWLYIPPTDRFEKLPRLPRRMRAPPSILLTLPDGRAVDLSLEDDAAEIYTPGAEEPWQRQHMQISSWTVSGAAVILDSGDVFIVGHHQSAPRVACHAWNVDTGVAAIMQCPKLATKNYAMVKLPDGHVLLTGGLQSGDTGPVMEDRCEEYSPETDGWYPAPPMLIPRANHRLVLLRGVNKVMAIGGDTLDCSYITGTPTCEFYDLATHTWQWAPEMPVSRSQHTATVFN
jgi:hypothetical protein